MSARRPLLIGLGLAVLGMIAHAGSPAVAQDGDGAVSLNPLRAIDKATLKGFLEQPLFDPTRRLPPVVTAPVVVATPVAVAPPEPPPTLRLLGVIHGRRDIAIVHGDNDEKTIILHTGDHFGGWIVTVIPPVGVRLRSADRAFDYALFLKPGAAPGPVAAVPEPKAVGSEALSSMVTRNARLQRRTY